MKKIFLISLICFSYISQAQVLENEETYGQEWVWGLNKNTNGGLIGGFTLRYSKIIREDLYQTFGAEVVNVKHPSETRFVSATGGRFIFGKQNYLYALRLQYGRDKLLYKKANQNGVQVNILGAAGPTLGFVAPYYVLSARGDYERFDNNIHVSPQSIASSGKLFQGLNESKIVPGINLKLGVGFEFGTYKGAVTGMEIGVLGEAYTNKIILISTQPNRAVFGSFYITFYRGRRK